jgi:hypothetical protein
MIRRLGRSLVFDLTRPFERLDPAVRHANLHGSRSFEGVAAHLMRRIKENETGEIQEYLTEYLS